MTALILKHFPLAACAPSGVKSLRSLILELAVSGALLQQNEDDEHAASLLTRISEEKVRRGIAPPRQKSLATVTDSLPRGWTQTLFAEVALEISTGPFGSLIHQSDYVQDGIPLINPSHMINGRIHADLSVSLTSAKAAELDAYRLEAGDMVMARRGEVGRVALVTTAEHGWLCGTGSFRLRFTDDVSREYVRLLFLCESSRRYLGGAAVGTTMVNLNHGVLTGMPVKLPPLAEQHRIVTKVDELMALCDRLEARQQDAEAAHTRLVQVLLDGLTQARDAEEFQASWERVAGQFEVLFTTEASLDALEQTICDMATTGLLSRGRTSGALPSGWRAASLGDVVASSSSGWSPSCEPRARTGDEWGVLKVSAVTWSVFAPDENKALPSSLQPRPEFEVHPGDFLISRANTAHLVARSVVVESTPARLMLSDKLVRLRFSSNCDPRFIQLVNSSSNARRYYAEVAGGTSGSMKNVTRPQIFALPIWLPPLEEQITIVQKVADLRALCSDLKERVALAKAKQAQLAEELVLGALAA